MNSLHTQYECLTFKNHILHSQNQIWVKIYNSCTWEYNMLSLFQQSVVIFVCKQWLRDKDG